MGLKVTKKTVKGTVTQETKTGAEIKEEKQVGEVSLVQPVQDAPTAMVGMNMSVTQNLGNYESLKVSIDLHIPCGLTEKDFTETFNRAKTWIEEQMNEYVPKMKDKLSND